MRRVNRIVILLALIMIPIYAFSLDIDSIYIQKNNKLFTLSDAIIRANGTISPIAGTTYYQVNVCSNHYVLDMKTKSSVNKLMACLYPGNSMVIITFLGVKPNKQIYCNDAFHGKTDNQGQAIIYAGYPSPGKYQIELRRNQTIVVDSSKLDLSLFNNSSIDITCTGIIHMNCKIGD